MIATKFHRRNNGYRTQRWAENKKIRSDQNPEQSNNREGNKSKGAIVSQTSSDTPRVQQAWVPRDQISSGECSYSGPTRHDPS